MYYKIRTFFVAFCFTIIFVPIGTLTHEIGHYTFAKINNIEAIIKYNRTDLPVYRNIALDVKNEVDEKMLVCANNALLENASFEWYSISSVLSTETKLKYKEYLEVLKFVTLGGPISTILIGSLAFIILFFRVKKEKICLNFINLLLIFFSFFWLREVFGFAMLFFSKNINLVYSDELILARLYKLPILSITITLAFIGLYVFYRIFINLDRKIRNHFLVGVGFGSIFGFFFWFILLGPILLP